MDKLGKKDINRQLSEEFRGCSLNQFFFMGAKTFLPPGYKTLTSQSTTTRTNHCAANHLPLLCCNPSEALLRSNRDHSKMKNESVKKSLEKSKNVQEKRKIVKHKICIKKTHTFTIIAMNFAQEQLINKD